LKPDRLHGLNISNAKGTRTTKLQNSRLFPQES
jgi:hypothetical protein